MPKVGSNKAGGVSWALAWILLVARSTYNSLKKKRPLQLWKAVVVLHSTAVIEQAGKGRSEYLSKVSDEVVQELWRWDEGWHCGNARVSYWGSSASRTKTKRYLVYYRQKMWVITIHAWKFRRFMLDSLLSCQLCKSELVLHIIYILWLTISS